METQFKEKAKKFNLYTKEYLPKVYTSKQVLNGSIFDYSNKVNNARLDLPDELLEQFNPVLLFKAREQQKNFSDEIELYYIEHYYTAFETPEGNIAILRYNSKNKKYYFTPYYGYFRQYQNIDHHIRLQAEKESGIKAPNYIGKFMAKKVQAWLNYCDTKINHMNSLLESTKDKNAEIERKIADFAVNSKGDVSRWSDQTQVKTKYFRVTFNHNKRSQYLYTKIEFTGNLNDVLNIESQ
jgi:hypothetical protein